MVVILEVLQIGPSAPSLVGVAGEDLRDGIYFASLAGVGLVLNTVLVERRRWA